MQYLLGEPPATDSEAFEALENTYGASDFSSEDAAEVIGNALDIDKGEAINHFRALLRSGSITPTVPTLGNRLIETAREVRRPTPRPVAPPVEEDEWGPGGPPVGEMSHEEQAKHFGEIG